MKKFIINIASTSLVSAALLCALTWFGNDTIKNADFKLDAEKHIIAIGPSTIGCALKSDIIDGFQNLSRNGSSFDVITPILPKILDENPQIDTVWINHGRLIFKLMTDTTSITENTRLQDLRYKMPLIIYGRETMDMKVLLSNINFYSAVLNPDPLKVVIRVINPSKNLEYFRFVDISKGDMYNLYKNNAPWGIHWYDSTAAVNNKDVYSEKWIRENCSSNDYWIREAIKICQERGVVPVLFCTPLYQYERWCPRDGFADYIKSYDKNILIADYEDFEFPSDSMYGDVHHLNKYGAEYFSKYIQENGLKTETISEWLVRNSKKQ